MFNRILPYVAATVKSTQPVAIEHTQRNSWNALYVAMVKRRRAAMASLTYSDVMIRS
jgi:hypothetical protein